MVRRNGSVISVQRSTQSNLTGKLTPKHVVQENTSAIAEIYSPGTYIFFLKESDQAKCPCMSPNHDEMNSERYMT